MNCFPDGFLTSDVTRTALKTSLHVKHELISSVALDLEAALEHKLCSVVR